MKILSVLACVFGCFFSAEAKMPVELEKGLQELGVQEEILSDIARSGRVEKVGKDAEIRPDFVRFQAALEHVIADLLDKGVIHKFLGMIHTPMPATPLCTAGEISRDLVEEDASGNVSRAATVLERAITVRELLAAGGKMYVSYPRVGLEKRSEVQKNVYLEANRMFPEALVDYPIAEPLPDDLIGATYFFADQKGEKYLFSIQATQANDARDAMHWKIRLDSLENPKCMQRLKVVDGIHSTGIFLNKN